MLAVLIRVNRQNIKPVKRLTCCFILALKGTNNNILFTVADKIVIINFRRSSAEILIPIGKFRFLPVLNKNNKITVSVKLN